MAKQYKKLQQKLHPKASKQKPKEKPVGKDYVLLSVICFILVVTIFGWEYLDNLNRAMYILLGVSMTCNYVRRHAKLSETQAMLVERTGMVTIGFAIALFLVALYYQFIA